MEIDGKLAYDAFAVVYRYQCELLREQIENADLHTSQDAWNNFEDCVDIILNIIAILRNVNYVMKNLRSSTK